MNVRPKKWRGPILLLVTSRRFRRWFAIIVSIPALYILSIGPACLLVDFDLLPRRKTALLYKPILIVACRASPQAMLILQWYASLFVRYPGFDVAEMAAYAEAYEEPPMWFHGGWESN